MHSLTVPTWVSIGGARAQGIPDVPAMLVNGLMQVTTSAGRTTIVSGEPSKH